MGSHDQSGQREADPSEAGDRNAEPKKNQSMQQLVVKHRTTVSQGWRTVEVWLLHTTLNQSPLT